MSSTQKFNTGRSSQFSDVGGSVQIAESVVPDALSSVFTTLAGMSITPVAGIYAVWFGSNFTGVGSGRGAVIQIMVGGVAVAASVRRQDFSSVDGDNGSIMTMAAVTVNGAQAIEGQAHYTAVGVTANERQLMITRVG